MDRYSVSYWYDGLEPQDKWLMATVLAVCLVCFTPWRRHLDTGATVRPKEGEATLLLAPGAGWVRAVRAVKGQVLEAGDVAFTYAPQADASRCAPPAATPVYGSRLVAWPGSPSSGLGPAIPANGMARVQAANPGSYQDEERKLREEYTRQMTEANAYIASNQQQLARAWSEQMRQPRGGLAYEVQLAQNALTRAQQVPAELGRKLAQDLAELGTRRESDARLNQMVHDSISAKPSGSTADGDSLTVPVAERVWVQASSLRPGLAVQPDQVCASLVPERAELEIQAALPAAFAAGLRPGQPASLEVAGWLQDAQRVPITLVQVGNRCLEPEEVQAFLPQAGAGGRYVLASFRVQQADGRLFPPPERGRIHMQGALRCLLQRVLF